MDFPKNPSISPRIHRFSQESIGFSTPAVGIYPHRWLAISTDSVSNPWILRKSMDLARESIDFGNPPAKCNKCVVESLMNEQLLILQSAKN